MQDVKVLEEKALEKKKEIISLSNNLDYKRSSSAPINTLNLSIIKDFEILDNSILDLKEVKSQSNNEQIIKNNLHNNIRSESMDSSVKIEETKEPELSLFDKIKFFDTPYDKLACISREIGLQIMIDYIINIININKRNIK